MPFKKSKPVKERLSSRKYKQLKNKVNINIIIQEEEEEDEVKTNSDLVDLLDELETIKSKRRLHFWVIDNKQWINGLNKEDKNLLMNKMRALFFPND